MYLGRVKGTLKNNRYLSLPAASGDAGGGGADAKGVLVTRDNINIEVVTHGQDVDGFWGVVRNGFKQAASDFGIKYNYSAPDTESDYVKMSQLIGAAVAKKPQGIIVSIPNAEALGPSIEKAVAADPNNAELSAALDTRRNDRLQEQVHEAQRRVDQNPTDPQLRYELGSAHYQAGDLSGAIPHVQQATRNPHIRTKVLLLLGRTFKGKAMFVWLPLDKDRGGIRWHEFGRWIR